MSAPVATTAQHPFFSMGPSAGDLFEVRVGLPAIASLEQASCFLGSVFQTLQDMAEAPNPDSIYGAAHLTVMAKAVIDSVASGLARQGMADDVAKRSHHG